ncbi:hypothetical protein B4N84_06655, partial [Flavobacterium sp. IR1]
TVQYNETTFDFLNRLAKRYGHYFYDNGRVMVFGAPGTSGGEPKLVYGANMQEFSYEMKVLPSQLEIIENDNRIGNFSTDQTLKYRNECDGFQQNFLNKSNAVFNQTAQQQLNQNPAGGSGKTALEEYAKNKMRAVLGKLMQVNAKSEVAGITLGNSVRITGVDVQLESSYCVTSITHFCEDEGTYENHFTAVNLNGSVFSPQTNPDLVPHCVSQTAIVTANADPDGLSFVQVQMPWQQAKNKTTPYIAMLQNYGGNSRGSHIIPEIGDTVLVEFQGNNAELPFVAGIMTNAKQKSGFSTPNNDLKVLATRSGNQLVMNDSAGSILLQDASNNSITLDGNNNISLRADTLHIDVKQLIINASESTQITTNDYTLNALSKIYISSVKLKQVIKGFMNLCSGKVLINSDDTIDIEGKVVKLHGKKQAMVHSDEAAMINSLGTAKIHGADGNHFTNTPEKIEAVPTAAVALAVVYFRPSPIWKGQYGFDWLREKDNGLNLEPDYESIIESGYKDGISNLTKTEAFEKLKKEYESIPITRKDAKTGTTEYFVPYLTLFSKEFVDAMPATTAIKPQYEAQLKLLFDIEEDLEKLEFEFDETLFKVSSKVLPIKTKTNGLEEKNTIIKFTCLKDLDRDHHIDLYAYPKARTNPAGKKIQPTIEDRKLAGRIRVLRNDSTVRREEKIVLINTWTDVDTNGEKEKGRFRSEEKENLYNTLHQAFIIPVVEETILDISTHVDFSIYCKHIHDEKIKFLDNDIIDNTLFEDCKKAFFTVTDSDTTSNITKYADYFTVFKFGLPSNKNNLLGSVQGIGKRNAIMFTLQRSDDSTLNHETLHGLGLCHSHRNHQIIPDSMSNYKYTFPCALESNIQAKPDPKNATDNVMGYRSIAHSTWRWQWKIINTNIR